MPHKKDTSAETLKHYGKNAEAFWEGTRDHDVSQNYAAFLGALPKLKPLEILDLGCGPGRDVLYFKKLGHKPTGLDGCHEFCEMARRLSGCDILEQDFLNLSLVAESFHGVFANASLFHVPSAQLVRVLTELHTSLKKGGILFSSNPRGDYEGWTGDRYGNFMELAPYQEFLSRSGFEVLDHYYRPSDKPPKEQRWLAVVAQKKS